MDKNFKIEKLYPEKEIERIIKRAALRIFREYFPLLKKRGELRLVFVAVLTGATRFRNSLSTEVGKLFAQRGYLGIIEEEEVSVSTYLKDTKWKKPKFLLDLKRDVKGAHVIIVEDVIDTGETIALVSHHLKKKGALSIKIYTLVDKSPQRRKKIKINFSGFKLNKNLWIVGYGMDINGKFRELPYIGYIVK